MLIAFYHDVSSYGATVYCYGAVAEDCEKAASGARRIIAEALTAATDGKPVAELASNDARLVDRDRIVIIGDMTLTPATDIASDGRGWIVSLALRPYRDGKPSVLLTVGGPVVFRISQLWKIGESKKIGRLITERVVKLAGLG